MPTSPFRFSPSILSLALIVVGASAVQATETIVITAGRVAQPLENTLAPMIVISREDIERSQALDAAELLRRHAGVEIARSGGPGQNVSVFLRGTESNHTLVLVDGVKINPGTIGGAALQNIPPALIERIEIVKGPHSSLYGSNAIGGVINIITRRAAAQDGGAATLHAQTGEHGTWQGGGGFGYRQGQTRAGLNLNYIDSEGFSPRRAATLARGHDNVGLNAYAGYALGEGLDMELSRFQAEGRTEYLDYALAPVDQDFQNAVTALTLRAQAGKDWHSVLRLSRAVDEIDQNQSDDFAHTERDTLDWQNDFFLSGYQRLNLGLEWDDEHTASSVFGTGYDEHTRATALFAQDTLDYGAHQASAALRYTDHEDFGGKTTGNLAYAYALSDATRLSASLGTAFRAPDSTDRFGYGGNPALKPENSQHAEMGLRHSLNSQQTLEFNAFHTELEDLISFQDPDGYLGAEPGRNENVERARIRGLELNYQATARPWRITLAGVYQQPKNLDTGQVLARRAERQGTLAVDYLAGKLELGADLSAAGKRKDSDFSSVYLGGYTVLDLRLGYRPGQNWRVFSGLSNVLDRDYELAAGYQHGGRAWHLGTRYDFDW